MDKNGIQTMDIKYKQWILYFLVSFTPSSSGWSPWASSVQGCLVIAKFIQSLMEPFYHLIPKRGQQKDLKTFMANPKTCAV